MLSTKQKEYLKNCNHRWNIKIGATGSGKSWLDYAYVIPKRLSKMKGQGAAVIIGNTQGTVVRNIIEPMREIWGEKLVGNITRNNAAKMFGQNVYVMGADTKKHIKRIQGMTIEYAYGDEMTTWNEGVFQMLKSRLRCEHSFFDGTGNPEAPTNFLKEFLDSNADIYYQKSTIFDNPFLPKQFVEELCKEYEGTVYYPRYILGEWTRAEGLIYPMYDDAITDEIPKSFNDYVLSIDYGTQNAFAAILWGLNDGVWYGVNMYYYSGRETGIQKTDDEYWEDINKFLEEHFQINDGEKPKRMEVIIDPSAASFIAVLRKKGRCKVKPADNAVADGIRETATTLNRGKIKIYRKTMSAWIKEAQGYSWQDGKEEPIKENDHAMDATRYFVKTKRLAKVERTYNGFMM